MAITHADETDQLGVAVEAACQFDLAPDYLLEGAAGGLSAHAGRARQTWPDRLLPPR